MILALAGIGGGAIRGEALRALLHDTMAMTGALFALFLAAVTFTLVFRAFGSDRLLADWVTRMPGGTFGALGLVLGLIALSALVLDAFEIVLVIVPLLMPPLLTRAPDAVWDSVLVLLVLQGSFLLPPFGYAVMMARGLMRERLPLRQVVRAITPFLAVQLLVLGLIIAIPRLVHLTSPDDTAIHPTYSDAEARQRLLRMTLPEPEPEGE
jgi:TRAP-type mannitol/chloroaromatic compound transport system permease large subunit